MFGASLPQCDLYLECFATQQVRPLLEERGVVISLFYHFGGNMIDFYYVDKQFIKYLQDYEKEARGFANVPNVDYDSNDKFFVGVVLRIGKYKYFAPISHYKKNKPHNVLINIITDKKNPIKGSVRLNYMFPVIDQYLTRLEIGKISDVKQKRLILKEYQFCVDNEKIIRTIANKAYIDIAINQNEDCVLNACAFKLLEQAIDELPPDLQEGEPDKGLALV